MTPAPIPALPAPRRPGPYRVTLVCLGNICRSPMAAVVLARRVDDAGLGDRVAVASCGTGGWHVGDPMDRRAAASLRAAGHDPSAHRARQLDPDSAGADDLVLAMDDDNLREVRGVLPGADLERVRRFRDFDPVGTGGVVPDPYYGGEQGFEEVLEMVERTSGGLVDALRRLLDRPGGDRDGDPRR